MNLYQTLKDKMSKDEIAKSIALGKEALVKHQIPEAFDQLFHAAHNDPDALCLFLMIPEITHRLHLLSKEQIQQVSAMADEGDPLSQYTMGRIHFALHLADDSIAKAKTLLEAAEKAGIADALASTALMRKWGYYDGSINLEKCYEDFKEAESKGSCIAFYQRSMGLIQGWDDRIPEPATVIDTIKEKLHGDESDDLLKVNPVYYEMLAQAYAKTGNRVSASEYYLKAIDMGLYECMSDYIMLALVNRNLDVTNNDMYRKMVDDGCAYRDPYCFVMRATNNMELYDEAESAAEERALHDKIFDDLAMACDLGEKMGQYYLGYSYYFGYYGFDENYEKAWKYFLNGAAMGSGPCWAMMDQMICEGNSPEVGVNFNCYCRLMALRLGDDSQLGPVVKAYWKGLLGEYADEISKYYVPRWYNTPIEDKIEGYDMRFIAVINADGSGRIIEYEVEDGGWDDLPPYISADELEAVEIDDLQDLSEELGYDKHITAWVDADREAKDLPLNIIADTLATEPIKGDIILTLEDDDAEPCSFDNFGDLKRLLKESLGVHPIDVSVEDYDGADGPGVDAIS